MSAPFVERFSARWVDMDFNQHMRNAAYLGCAEETRMRFLVANGFPPDELRRLQLGPVTVEDKLTYKQELRLLEPFSVELTLVAITDDARKMKLRNRVLRDRDGALCATVESVGLWFDIAARRPVAPPEDLRAVWLGLHRSEDFERW